MFRGNRVAGASARRIFHAALDAKIDKLLRYLAKFSSVLPQAMLLCVKKILSGVMGMVFYHRCQHLHLRLVMGHGQRQK